MIRERAHGGDERRCPRQTAKAVDGQHPAFCRVEHWMNVLRARLLSPV
ncbi:hypothetical protein HMPREF9607_02664 [Cutibacterium modestum HL044PA1]|uniref:Uncharacterized protein n=1 Tax=Cutibacterium modestum HL044PA1 TaxID=765109 RepID=A0ABP2K3J1_9ACTN|nr:hypothetical protein HMPREF9607_02664 [Cutibacterium modestum HL044PA1]